MKKRFAPLLTAAAFVMVKHKAVRTCLFGVASTMIMPTLC